MIYIILALGLCAFESFTKGWYSLLLIPISLVLLPVEFFLQAFARRSSYAKYRDIMIARPLQLTSLVAAYVFIVGFGDTQDVLLFGFMNSTISTGLTNVSAVADMIALVMLASLTIYLVTRLIFIKIMVRRG